MYGGVVRRILCLPFVARCLDDTCLYMAHVCFYVCCSDGVGDLWECLLCSGRC